MEDALFYIKLFEGDEVQNVNALKVIAGNRSGLEQG